ncbi:MAG: TetR/AcrR family transcriptional regulator [Sphingomonadales bacterium]|nr:TetR/AcrR family transcriptional regulator [Sphingomonadales bacterium]
MKQAEHQASQRNAGTRNRHAEVLAHAVHVLNSRGVSQTSLGQIADDLGISRAALYYYVDDLQDLVFQCYRETCIRLTAQMGDALRIGGNEAEVIARFITESLDPNGREFASLSEIGVLSEAQKDEILGLYDGLLAQLAGVIAKGVSTGRLRPCDGWIAAHTIISMIFWIPISEGWVPAVRSVPHAPSANALVDLVLNGIVAPGAHIEKTRELDFGPLFPSSKGLFDKEFLTLARKEALLRAASQLFNQKGIDATSLDEVAAAVGATKRAILHYFGDKLALAEQAYKRAYRIYLFIPQTLAASDLTPVEQLSSAWIAISEAYLQDDVAPLTSRAGLGGFGKAAREDIEGLSVQLTRDYREILANARAAGQLRQFDDGAFLMVVAGACSWLARGIFSAEPSEYGRISKEISDLLMMGLRHE